MDVPLEVSSLISHVLHLSFKFKLFTVRPRITDSGPNYINISQYLITWVYCSTSLCVYEAGHHQVLQGALFQGVVKLYLHCTLYKITKANLQFKPENLLYY